MRHPRRDTTVNDPHSPTNPPKQIVAGTSNRLLGRGSWREARYVADLLRTETVGGAILLAAAIAALVWANSPWRDGYATLRDTVIGPHALHLDLSLGTWAADGLLAVLAVIGTHLPSALRSFLLTLAVVDDLIAITIIAVFYTETVNLLWLLAAVAPLAAWRLLLKRKITNPAVLAVPALLAWGFVHSSGVHATVAGVMLGLLVPVNREVADDPDRNSLA